MSSANSHPRGALVLFDVESACERLSRSCSTEISSRYHVSIYDLHSVHPLTVPSGGGPGGMALAMAIRKFNDPDKPVVVDVYESQSAIGTIGAGISVWPRTRALLEHLGLMKHFKGELNAQNAHNVGEDVGRGARGCLLGSCLSYILAYCGAGFLYRKSDQADGYPLYHMPMSSGCPVRWDVAR